MKTPPWTAGVPACYHLRELLTPRPCSFTVPLLEHEDAVVLHDVLCKKRFLCSACRTYTQGMNKAYNVFDTLQGLQIRQSGEAGQTVSDTKHVQS